MVNNYSILVDLRTQDEISGLLFDLNISVAPCLIEPGTSSHPEDGFPRVCSRQGVVKLVGKLHPVSVGIELRIVEKAPAGLPGKIRKCHQVLELSLAMGKNEEIAGNLGVSKLGTGLCEVGAGRIELDVSIGLVG